MYKDFGGLGSWIDPFSYRCPTPAQPSTKTQNPFLPDHVTQPQKPNQTSQLYISSQSRSRRRGRICNIGKVDIRHLPNTAMSTDLSNPGSHEMKTKGLIQESEIELGARLTFQILNSRAYILTPPPPTVERQHHSSLSLHSPSRHGKRKDPPQKGGWILPNAATQGKIKIDSHTRLLPLASAPAKESESESQVNQLCSLSLSLSLSLSHFTRTRMPGETGKNF